MTPSATESVKSAAELPEAARAPLADLLLVLADNKRLLGIRYADWILGAPALEAGIACSAMAQDEWGHGRILYAMLRDFDLDPDALEHERERDAYRNSELLDVTCEGWPGLLALNLLLDTALTVQFEAMRRSRYQPLRHKVSKLLEEERYHFEHGRGWVARLAGTKKGREALSKAFTPAFASCLRWFGHEGDDGGTAELVSAGVLEAGPEPLRARWLARVGPLLDLPGWELVTREEGGSWSSPVEIDWEGWDARTRRTACAIGPEPRTLERVRGDRNRDLLLD